jgi:hypothetical protein
MATPNDLAAQLGNMRLHTEEQSIQQTHVLNFKFPAVELLDSGSEPFFTKPSDIGHRLPPSTTSCQSKSIGTKFFTIFFIGQEDHPFDVTDVAYGDYKRLVIAIDDLKLRPGESSLGIVCYNATSHLQSLVQLRYRFRLTTSVDGNARYEDFELDEDQFGCLHDFVDEQDWIEILFGLVNMESERAFLEFISTVTEAYGDNFASTVDVQWGYQWLNCRPRTVEEIFKSRFQIPTYKEFVAFDEPGDITVRASLPCGHDIMLRKIWLESISGKACLMQECLYCRRRIMGSAVQDELERGEVWNEMMQYKEEVKSWLELEALPPMAQVTVFSSVTLIDAIMVALESFDMPEYVCPDAMCPISFMETEYIKNVFREAYGDKTKPVPFVCSAEDLCGDLTQIASEAVAKEGITNLTPGLEAFVNGWVLRAVNLLAHRPCARKGRRHRGVHKHETSWHFNDKMLPHGDEQDEEEQEKAEDLLDEMYEKLKEASVEERVEYD